MEFEQLTFFGRFKRYYLSILGGKRYLGVKTLHRKLKQGFSC